MAALPEPSNLTGMHIHSGAFGDPGPIHFDMGTDTTGGANTLIQECGDWNWGTVNNGYMWTKPQLQAVVDNPEGFHVNIHTEAYQPGAIRAQIPEPATLGLLSLAGLLLMRRRMAPAA